MGLRSSSRPVMNILLLLRLRNSCIVEKRSNLLKAPALHPRSIQKISSSVCTWGRTCADSARNWVRIFAIVRRFQKATAVAPRIAEPAMRNAVDQRPLLGVAFPESVPANSSCLDSCVLAFPEVPIILSFSVRQRIFRTR